MEKCLEFNTRQKNKKKIKQGQITDAHLQCVNNHDAKIVSEYDQEIPQSQTADNPMAQRGRATQPSRDTRKTN